MNGSEKNILPRTPNVFFMPFLPIPGPFFLFLYFPRLLRSRGKSVLFLSEKGPGKRTDFFRLLSESGEISEKRRIFFYSAVPRKFHEFSGDSGIEKNSPFSQGFLPFACFSRGKQDLRSCFPLFPPISILFPLPKEEEKIRLFSFRKKDQKSEENPFFSPSHFMAREKNLSHKWLGKKNLRHAPANPFMRFARRAVNGRKPWEKGPSPAVENRPLGPRSEIGGPGGDFRRQARVLFLSEKGRVFPYSEGVRENIEIGENAPLPSKIASDLRRQRSGPPKIHRIFGGQRKKRSKYY